MAHLTAKQVIPMYQERTGYDWGDVDPKEQEFIVAAWTDFQFFLRWVYYPHELHGMWSKANAKRTRLYKFQETLAYICQYVLPKHGKVTIEAPTGSSKTDTVAKGYTLWRVARDRRIRVGLYTHDAKKTDRHMSKFRSHFEKNDALSRAFGPFWNERHEKRHRWGGDVIQVIGCGGTETITAASYGGESEGLPFDVIILDDVQGRKEAATVEQREKAWQWFEEVVEYRLREDSFLGEDDEDEGDHIFESDPEKGVAISIGTRQNPGDVHQRARERGDWKAYCFPAVLKWAVVKDPKLGIDGEYELVEDDAGRIRPVALTDNWLRPPVVLLPERQGFTYPEMCQERKQKPAAFARKRQNLVRDEGAKLFPRAMLAAYCRADGGVDPEGRRKPLLRAWNIHEGRPHDYPLEFERIILSVDLAATAKTKARSNPDYTVFLLLGVTKDKTRVVLDVLRMRISSPSKQRARLLACYQTYRPTRPPIVESNACQRLWATDLTEQSGLPVIKEELKATKMDEIESMADVAHSGKFLIPWDENDPHTMAVMGRFEAEITSYPDTLHDDQLIALILAERHVLRSREIAAVFARRRPDAAVSMEPTAADEAIDFDALSRTVDMEAGKLATLDGPAIAALQNEGRMRKRKRRQVRMPAARWLQ